MLAIMILALFPALAPAANDHPTISLLADESLSLPLTEIARQFSAAHGVSVTCTYAPPLQNMHEINEGASADVFVTAYGALLQQLRRNGMADVYSLHQVASARLAYMRIPSRDSYPGGVVIPSPTLNPEGVPAEHLAAGAPEWKHKVHYVASSALLAEAMERLGAIGITYETEARRLPGLSISPVKDSSQLPQVSFEAIVVAGENMDRSRILLDYLQSDAAKAVFRRYGFETP